jgi:hypothetical protein
VSETKQRAAARRDFRHTRGDPEVPPFRGKRDRSKCKRAPDGAHSLVLHNETEFSYLVTGSDILRTMTFSEYRCTHCGKKDFKSGRGC